jgi:carbon-monoxide dehydrogenase medium subunit
MRPAPFEYLQPTTVEQACAVLAEHRGRAAVLAGGQSLVAQLNARQRRPEVVCDITRIPELAGVDVGGDRVSMGAAVTQRAAERGPASDALPVLGEALAHVGHVPTRNRGTVGGSIAHADPAAELPVLLLALGGSVRACSVDGERTIPAAQLFTGAFRTGLRPDELLTAVLLPVPGGRWAFEQRDFRRHAKVSVVAGWDGTRLTVAAAGVTDTPVIVVNGVLDAPERAARETAQEAARAAAGLVTPNADLYGAEPYRRRLVALAAEAAVRRVLGDPGGHCAGDPAGGPDEAAA